MQRLVSAETLQVSKPPNFPPLSCTVNGSVYVVATDATRGLKEIFGPPKLDSNIIYLKLMKAPCMDCTFQ